MTTTPYNEIKNLMEMGLEEEAIALEAKYKKEHPGKSSIGSVVTEKWLKKFITVDPEMKSLKDEVRVLASEPDPVLILGETGTGKELLAQALHNSRPGKFVAINCTSLPSELLESELFGHVRGAFTGAADNRPGLLQSADNGTAFLDEIGDMSLDMQAKLLRALQDKKARRLGSNEEFNITARIVCATNHENIANEPTFRPDLYHRISTFILHPLPVRERTKDINLILDDLDPLIKFPRDFNWKVEHLTGNVRSIQSHVRRFLVFGKLPI